MTALAILVWPATLLLVFYGAVWVLFLARSRNIIALESRIENVAHEVKQRLPEQESNTIKLGERIKLLEQLNLEHELARLRAIVEGQVARK